MLARHNHTGRGYLALFYGGIVSNDANRQTTDQNTEALKQLHGFHGAAQYVGVNQHDDRDQEAVNALGAGQDLKHHEL